MSDNPQKSQLFNAKYVDDLILQIENATQCDAIELILDSHVKLLTELIKGKIDTQLEIASKYLPILKLPGADPFEIVSWIKKLVGGSIMPQLEAYIVMTLQIVQITAALSRLSSALAIIPRRLEACTTDAVTNVLVNNVGGLVNEYTAGLTESLNSINSIQNGLEDVLGEALTARIDTSSVSEFLKDPLDKLNVIQNQVKVFVDQPIVPHESFSGAVEISPGTSLVIQNGQVINVSIVEE